MKNFPFEHNGQELWYSRSLACNTVVLRYDSSDRTIEVLAVKRGQGCEFNKGLWNLPGGFIDFDENSKDCAIRETFEETGVKLPYNQVMFQFLDTDPHGKRQTMIASHSAVFPKIATKDWTFTDEHAEEGEVEEIRWMDLNEVLNYKWVGKQINNIKTVIHNNPWILDLVGFDKYKSWY